VRTSRINVEVTDSDIKGAKRGDSFICAVSVAIARTVPDATRIEVDSQTIRFTTGDGQRLLYLTPYAVQGYVIGFDAGDPIEPFHFQLRDPQRVARRLTTPDGKKVTRAARSARDAKKESSASLEDVRKAAKISYSKARKQASGPLTISDDGGRRPTPRVFKKKARSYGHRLLRINQEPVE
jgi:hypothetical protein